MRPLAIVMPFLLAACDGFALLPLHHISARTLLALHSLDEARNKLFQDASGAAARRAEVEGGLLQASMQPLAEPLAKRGTGFGGPKLSKAEKLEALRVDTLQTDGVCLIRQGLTVETAAALREAALDEVSETSLKAL